MAVSRLTAGAEVRADTTGRVLVELARTEYRARRRGTVVLALNAVSGGQADRALGPIVTMLPGVAGVAYCTPPTLTALLRQSGRPGVACVHSRALAAALKALGMQVLASHRGLGTLREVRPGRAGRGLSRRSNVAR